MSSGPTFNSLIQYVFNPVLVLPIILTTLLVFIITSIILLHHWKVYSADKRNIKKITTLYFLGCGFLLAIMLIAGTLALR